MTPYDDLDAPVVRICRAINALPGLHTIGSCGGHEEGGELPADRWRVSLYVEQERDRRPTFAGWLALEFLAWTIRDHARGGSDIAFLAWSLPPYLNDPGQMLRFSIEARRGGDGGIEADHLAANLEQWTADSFRPYASELLDSEGA